jgi:hypothetical protein
MIEIIGKGGITQVALFEVVRIRTGPDGKPAVKVISKPKAVVLHLTAPSDDANR